MTMLSTPPVVRVTVSTRQAVVNRLRLWKVAFLVMALAAVAVAISMISKPPENIADFNPENRNGNGTQALATVLSEQGVSNQTRMGVTRATAEAKKESTVVITPEAFVDSDDLEPLLKTGAHIVMLSADYYTWGVSALDDLRAEYEPGDNAPRNADCDLPDAPPTIKTRESLFYSIDEGESPSPELTLCYPQESFGAQNYALVNFSDSNNRLTLVAASDALTNKRILESDNAAFAIWLLGEYEDLYWVTEEDPNEGENEIINPLFPDWLQPTISLLTITGLFAMFWRGRRFGRLATEKLPVTVRPGETILGRGRLYQRSRAYGHAAASLRAGTVSRLAHRLKFGKHADPASVVEAIAAASGRPHVAIEALLYGPQPYSDEHLVDLAAQLEDLENEVQFL